MFVQNLLLQSLAHKQNLLCKENKKWQQEGKNFTQHPDECQSVLHVSHNQHLHIHKASAVLDLMLRFVPGNGEAAAVPSTESEGIAHPGSRRLQYQKVYGKDKCK